MILLDNWVKHRSKVLVGVPVSGVDATMLIWKLNRDLNGFPQSEATGLSFDVLQLRPDLPRDIFLHQGLLGFDVREVSGSRGRQCRGGGAHERVDSEHVAGYKRGT